jgi:hypothetical protein
VPEFVLQFPIGRVREYAARFPDEDEATAIATGRAARDRGHYTRAEFVAMCRWKSPRSAPLVALNTAAAVKKTTGVALGTASNERDRMDALLSLRGVGWPTASVLLHLAYPERYPILDQRALLALGVAPKSYSFRFWEAYVTSWLRIAEQAGVDGRTLDQALWQWSKEQGGRLS